MENRNKKIGFFSRVKIAVTKLENYSIFLEEKTSVAVKYFFLIVLCLSIVIATVETYAIMPMLSKGMDYIRNELPEFSYANGNLEFSQKVQAYDEEYDITLIADTQEEISEENLQQYEKNIKNVGIIFLKDKAIYKAGGGLNEYYYGEISEQYNITSLDRALLIAELENVGLMGIAVSLFLLIIFGVYILQIMNIFMDWIVIAVFAYIVSRICRMNMTMKHTWNISIYALTLSIILTMLYSIAYYLVGFSTEYFRIWYLLVAYIYVVAVILMIKSDLMKQQIEVSKIVEEQNKVHEEKESVPEKEEQPEDKEEKEDKKEKELPVDEEPDGSEI